jgi:hypothetical protein
LLYGFDENKLDVGYFSGLIKLNDLIFRPDTVNKMLEKQNFPFQLKAGIISKVNVKVGPPFLDI